jgi:hypothetical protein
MNQFCVFIPAYNASETILLTLCGINTAANQINQKVDVFIVDDCSPLDSCININIIDYPFLNINIFRNQINLGERGTINKYFNLFINVYEWAFLIHADDIPKFNWLDVITKVIDSNTNENIFTIWSSFDVIDENNSIISLGDNSGGIHKTVGNSGIAAKYITKITSSYHVSGSAINLNLYNQIGGFDAKLPQYGDTTFFADGLMKGLSHIYIKYTLTLYKISSFSVSKLSSTTNRDIKEIEIIINHYRSILTLKQVYKIKIRCLYIIFKRATKYLINKKISSSFDTIKLFKNIISA